MTFAQHSPRRFQHGFSLVEIMMALLIGMFGVIVMMQVFSISETQKRNATGAGDAQGAGSIALYGIQRDLRMSGYGIAVYNLLGCNLTLLSGGVVPLAPVVINPAVATIPAGDANTDRLLVFYGSANAVPEGNVITTNTAPNYRVISAGTVVANDYVFTGPVPAATCAGNLVLDRVTAAAGNNVTVANGAAGVTLYSLGQGLRIWAYAVRNGNLTVCDYVANNCGDPAQTNDTTRWVPIANNVVSLRAQYGRDVNNNTPAWTQAAIDGVINAAPNAPHPPPNYIVDTYDQTTPTAGAAVHPSPCGWARIPAVRLALTVRNAQYEKEVVTAAEPTWEGSATLPIDVSKQPDGSANPDWQNYRYKVFQTTVPLRNVAWMGVQAGC
ncbi:MAG: PilW family protein [Burkholderiales bacterium]|nr:PilW family protein [Burkholderiales bacterium]